MICINSYTIIFTNDLYKYFPMIALILFHDLYKYFPMIGTHTPMICTKSERSPHTDLVKTDDCNIKLQGRR